MNTVSGDIVPSSVMIFDHTNIPFVDYEDVVGPFATVELKKRVW